MAVLSGLLMKAEPEGHLSLWPWLLTFSRILLQLLNHAETSSQSPIVISLTWGWGVGGLVSTVFDKWCGFWKGGVL